MDLTSNSSNEPGEDEQFRKQKMNLLKPIIPSGSKQSTDREMREKGKKKKKKRIERPFSQAAGRAVPQSRTIS